MKKVVLCNISTLYNFGGPSLLHGMNELLINLFGNDYNLTGIIKQQSNEEKTVSDISMNIMYIKEFRVRKLLLNLLKYKISKKLSRDNEYIEIIKIIDDADVLIDLFGICFCDKLDRQKDNTLTVVKSLIGEFPFSYVAKKLKTVSIKYTASYGPIEHGYNQKKAVVASKSFFDCFIARERESYDALISTGIKCDVLIAPDTANLMKYSNEINNETTIGISVSYQMIKQWQNSQEYVDCIANLCKHIIEKHRNNIILIPNDNAPSCLYNDVDVAEDIMQIIKMTDEKIHILDVGNLTSTQIKNTIASCEVMVASRYHSCVAALSSCVPTLVIGWHYKYKELLHLYEQDKWLLSESDCDSSKLISIYDEFWNQRDVSKKTIKQRYEYIQKLVIDTGRKALANKVCPPF